MRYVITLASIPMVIWAATPSSAPIVAKVVPTESIREQRQDAATFALRWRPVADLPPTVVKEIHHLVLVASDEVVGAREVAEGTQQGNAAASRHRTRRVSLRADVCARHGQRKVMVGRYKWRCKR